MLVSPAEHHASIRALGKYHSLPEKFGCDMLFACRGEWVGVQRKEYSDLIQSVFDGRLAKEMGQMQRLTMKMLVVEGRPQWSLDGRLMGNGFGGREGGRDWTLAHHHGVLWGVRAKGVWVEWSEGVVGTTEIVKMFQRWCEREHHGSVERRPGPAKDAWGARGNEDYARHLVMGLEGVGPELAGRIVERFGGVPWAWTVGVEELMTVEGIGKVKAAKMMGALGVSNPTT